MPAPAEPSLPKSIIFSAPSGAGKTTILHRVLQRLNYLAFSISATTRPKRPYEENGRDYYFMSQAQFEAHKAAEDFIEWEQVYSGIYYGTLRSELTRIATLGFNPLFEVDVKGGLHLKQIFGPRALAVFIQPPSLEALRERLESRNTEQPEEITRRLTKASEEMAFAEKFDCIVLNDSLDRAVEEVLAAIEAFVKP